MAVDAYKQHVSREVERVLEVQSQLERRRRDVDQTVSRAVAAAAGN